MKNMPLVTVVTVVKDLLRNKRRNQFLHAIRSVQEQAYPNVEHLIVDGCSADGTVEMLRTLEAEHKITRFVSMPDTGIYDGMNHGVSEAKGEYVAFLNSDDFYHNPKAIAQSVEALENSAADFSFGTVRMINEEMGALDEGLLFYPFEGQFIVGMPFSHQSMFVRRSVLLKEKFDMSFKLAADYDLINRLYLNGYDGVEVKCEVATYRMSGVSSQRTGCVYEEYLKVFKKNYSGIVSLRDEEILYMLESYKMTREVLSKILPVLAKANKSQYERVFGKIQFWTPLFCLKMFARTRLMSLLPTSSYEKLHAMYRDYFDVDVRWNDMGLYLFGWFPLFHVMRSLDGSIFKFKLLGVQVCRYKARVF